MNNKSGFLGTYFDRDNVLHLVKWVQIIAWSVLAAYAIEAGINIFQTLTNSIMSGYPVDWIFFFMTISRVLQGAVLFILLNVSAKALMIMLDIEDNTRRSARTK